MEIAFLIEIASNPGSRWLFFFPLLPSSLGTPKQKADKEGDFPHAHTQREREKKGGERERAVEEQQRGAGRAGVILNHAKPHKAAARDWAGRLPAGRCSLRAEQTPHLCVCCPNLPTMGARRYRMRGGGEGFRTHTPFAPGKWLPWVKCKLSKMEI